MEAHPVGLVVHLVVMPLNGHVLSKRPGNAHDCWCEPATIFWAENKIDGSHVLIVEHNDYTLKHRTAQLDEQERGIPEDLAWINKALYSPESYPSAPAKDIRARLFGSPEEGDN